MHKQILSLTGLVLLGSILPACGAELEAEKNLILERDARNQTVQFSLRTDGTDLTYCVTDVSGDASPMDVFRVFLHAADTLKDRRFDKVNLCFRDEVRFVLDGAQFAIIGKDYEKQNPMYTVRTFPEKLLWPDGAAAYQTHRGGVLYLMRVQMADFNDMNKKWFLNELAAERKAKTDSMRPKEFASDEEAF